MIYILIFIFKILENTLATLRMILVSNGKKEIGAILSIIISVIWIITTGIVIIDINKDILKIIFFCLGTGLGSYLGSILEHIIALGNNLITIIINKEHFSIIGKLRYMGYAVTSVKAFGLDSEKYILLISIPRKNKKELIDIIKSVDKDSIIISENINPLYGGYLNK